MQIPFCSVQGLDDPKPYVLSNLSEEEQVYISTVASRFIRRRAESNLLTILIGLIHSTQSLQVFGFISCTGWVIIVAIEPGPYDSEEVSRSLFDRVYGIIVDICCNPFFVSLSSTKRFGEQLSNAIQSHSVMMTFMASSQVLG
jgi:hypothetical protein